MFDTTLPKDPEDAVALIERDIAEMMSEAVGEPKAKVRKQIFNTIAVLVEWLQALEDEEG